MSETAMLNVRLDKTLKQHGMEALERQGVSVTEAVRLLFEYLENNQSLPEGLCDAPTDVNASRRALLRSVVGTYATEEGFDFNATRDEYRERRASKTEAGVRA